jgi:Na+/H+ antiporter NhaD/arsenite permease-like protein
MNAILALSGFIAPKKFNRVVIALVGAAAMVIFGAGVSAVLSGIVDNIPYVASISPGVLELSKTIPASAGGVLWRAPAFDADFGGNATIIGASSNVVIVGVARKAGIHISFRQFAKYGIPVTFLTVNMGVPYLLLRYL